MDSLEFIELMALYPRKFANVKLHLLKTIHRQSHGAMEGQSSRFSCMKMSYGYKRNDRRKDIIPNASLILTLLWYHEKSYVNSTMGPI